jgi:hypothetical protein
LLLLLLLLLVLATLALENYSSIVSSNVYLENYQIGNSPEEQSIDWYIGDGMFISVPDPSLRVPASTARTICRNVCASCRNSDGQYGGLVSLDHSNTNIAVFNYIAALTLARDPQDYPFWVGLVQYDAVMNYVEPGEGFYWDLTTGTRMLDRLDTVLWKSGEPDDVDDDTGAIGANCGCFDARFPDGLFDCSCDSLRIPVCFLPSKRFFLLLLGF